MPGKDSKGGALLYRRRAALKLFTCAMAAPLLLLSAVSSAGKSSPWKLAIGLNGFQSGARKYKKNYPIWEVLDFAASNGFEGVELVGDWLSGPYPKASEKDRIAALRRLYEKYGLRLFSIQLSASDAFAPEADTRTRWLEDFSDRIQFARQLGCDCVGLWPHGSLRGQNLEEAVARLSSSFYEAAGIAAKQRILACYEIEPPFAFNSPDHLLRILRGANHPNLKVIYDPSHFDLMNGSTGRPEELLERVGVANIGYLQFCDTDGTLRDGGTSTHLACGDGHTDCGKALRLLRDGGFQGWVMIDTWEIPDPYDAFLKCKRFFDQSGG